MTQVVPDRYDSEFDGFPSAPLLVGSGSSTLGMIRNGQPAVGAAVRHLERAAINLGARRKISIPGVSSRPIAVTQAMGSVTIPITRLQVQPYTQYFSVIVLYSTYHIGVSVAMALTTPYGTYPTGTVLTWPSSSAHTRLAAVQASIDGVVTGTNAPGDLALVTISLAVSVSGKIGTDSANIYGLSLFPEPPEVIDV